MPPSRDRLADLSSELRKAVEALRRDLVEAGTVRQKAAQRNFCDDLAEASFIVEWLVECLEDAQAAQAALTQQLRSAPATGTLGPQAEDAYGRATQQQQRAVVLVKAIYQSLDAMASLSQVADFRWSPGIRDEWRRVLRFRNQLLSHKQNAHAAIHVAQQLDPDALGVTFGFNPLTGGDAACETDMLWRKAVDHLPEALRSETNVFERRAAMYEHVEALPGPMRGRLEASIARWGVRSDSAVLLAKLLLAIAHELTSASRP